MLSRHIPCFLLLLAGVSAACARASATTPAPAAPNLTNAVAGAQVVRERNMLEGVIGVYWLTADAGEPHLEMDRSLMAQGDLYALSIRPFLTPTSLSLLSTTPGDPGTTDYTVRFRHPYPIPPDFEPPTTASKRMDLFIFDLQLLLGLSGSDTFFGGAVTTNWAGMPTPSGFRQVGPLVDMTQLGVPVGTNTFPYQLIADIDPLEPTGNYDAVDGWSGAEWLAPAGYDAVPQGAVIDTVVRLDSAIALPVPVVLLAKYMDPRSGTTTAEKRSSRLPDATDPTRCLYFLPEACGDLQRITTVQSGALVDNSSADIMSLTATLLDWDNAATKASSFPNQSALTQIAEVSRPTQTEASFPQLRATGVFAGNVTATPSGIANELIDVTFAITNVDQTLVVPDAAGVDVPGLLRFRDTQDLTAPAQLLLNESQVIQSIPPGFEPSTRFQKVSVHVGQGPTGPVITGVESDTQFALRPAVFTLNTTGEPATSWAWDFGGGATPNTSTDESPVVTLGIAGVYNGTVTATNAFGSSAPFPFTLTVENRLVGIRVVAITSGGAPPGLWYNLSAWNGANVWTWLDTYVNPAYIPAGVQLDPAQFDYETLEYPAVYNVDTGTEHSWLMAVIYDRAPDKLNLYVVNSAPWFFNLGGIAGDANCNPDNVARGCYVVPDGTIDDVKAVAHELGHVMHLPHIRTALPLLPKNNNLMSYHTPDLSLWDDISADDPFTFCWLWGTNPMNQQQVVNNWCHMYMP